MTNPTFPAAPPWEPLWETPAWQDDTLRGKHAPMSQWAWAFSWRQGIPVPLQTKWTVERDSKGKVDKWVRDDSKLSNPDKDLQIPWSVVQAATEESRNTGISLKAAVAKRVDPNDPNIPPVVFVNFARAPEVRVMTREEVSSGPTESEKQAAANDFWSKIKAGTAAPPKPSGKASASA